MIGDDYDDANDDYDNDDDNDNLFKRLISLLFTLRLDVIRQYLVKDFDTILKIHIY